MRNESLAIAAALVLVTVAPYSASSAYDDTESHPSVINPAIGWSTYLTSAYGEAKSVVVDHEGNSYITGFLHYATWISGGFDETHNGYMDCFVAKLDPSGNHVWSTYIGGQSEDYGTTIALDAHGNVYVGGVTQSRDWARGGSDTTYNGRIDGFVAKLSPSGRHIWSRYVGGGKGDRVLGLAVSPDGNIYVTGNTSSYAWIPEGFGLIKDGTPHGFLLKLHPNSESIWSLYLGNGRYAAQGGPDCKNLAVDAEGNIYLAGHTTDIGYVAGGYDTDWGGWGDGFLMKLSAAGEHLWSTYIGAETAERDCDVALGPDSSVYVAGSTIPTEDMPSPNWVSGGFDTVHDGGSDGFVIKLTAEGQHVWSTFLGGVNDDSANGIAVGQNGDIYVTGRTESDNWTRGGFDTTHNGLVDGFVVRLTGNGNHVWSACFGGDRYEDGLDVATGEGGNIHIVGHTTSPEWITGGFTTPADEPNDGFSLLVTDSSGPLTAKALPPATVGEEYGVTLKGAVDVPPPHYNLVSGALPDALLLNTATGTIEGIPTATGCYAFTVDLTDSGTPPCTVPELYTLLVASHPPTRLLIRRLSIFRNPRKPNSDCFALQAYLNLTDLLLDWSAVPVTVGVGPYEAVFPAGSFVTRDGSTYFYRAPRGSSSGISYLVVDLRRRLLRVNAKGLDLSAIGETVRVTASAGDFRGSCLVRPSSGKAFVLGAKGVLCENAFLVERALFTLNPRLAGRDRMALSISMRTTEMPDLTTEQLTVSVGDLSWILPPGSFRQLGSRRIFVHRGVRGGELSSVVADFEKGKLTIAGKNMKLGGMGDGVDVSFAVGDLYLVTSIELTRRGNRLFY